MPDLPTRARVVIVGGGIAGASTAYHLAKLGVKDVVLLEQGKLTCGTTWHAAGLVGQMRATRNATRMSRYGIELYSSLEKETGLGTGWKQCGSLNVAKTPERLTLMKRQMARAKSFGIEFEFISPDEAGTIAPILRTDDLSGAVWIPGDGKANPTDLTQSLAKGARMRGAAISATVDRQHRHTDRGEILRAQGQRLKRRHDAREDECERVALAFERAALEAIELRHIGRIDDVERTQHVPAPAASFLRIGGRRGGKGGQPFEHVMAHLDVVGPLDRIGGAAVGTGRADLNHAPHVGREAHRVEDRQEPHVGVAEHVDVLLAEVPANGVDVLHLEIQLAGQTCLVRHAVRPAAVARVEGDHPPRRRERLKLIEKWRSVGNQQQALARADAFEVETDAVIRRDVAVGHRATPDGNLAAN